MNAPTTPAGRAMAGIERAHRLYTTGRTSHAQYVAAVSVALAIWKSPPAEDAPRQVQGFAKTWPVP